MKITKTQTLQNDSLEHLSQVLHKLFKHSGLSFDLEYFVGEDEKGTRLLCFLITTSVAGIVYEKYQPLQPHEVVADHEDFFMESVVDDLVLAGIGFLHVEKINFNNLQRKDGKIIETKVIYLN